MTSKHTPGPWDFDKADFGHGSIEYGIFRPETHIEGDTVDYIATVHDAGTETDARLIAEAPAILAALRELVAGNYGQPWGVTVPALDTARAILARIDGDSTDAA